MHVVEFEFVVFSYKHTLVILNQAHVNKQKFDSVTQEKTVQISQWTLLPKMQFGIREAKNESMPNTQSQDYHSP